MSGCNLATRPHEVGIQFGRDRRRSAGVEVGEVLGCEAPQRGPADPRSRSMALSNAVLPARLARGWLSMARRDLDIFEGSHCSRNYPQLRRPSTPGTAP